MSALSMAMYCSDTLKSYAFFSQTTLKIICMNCILLEALLGTENCSQAWRVIKYGKHDQNVHKQQSV